MDSLEVAGIKQFLKNSGVPHKITATVGRYISVDNPCSPHSSTSIHCAQGTGGRGRAADAAWTSPSWDSPQLLAIFNAFKPVEKKLSELIYAGAPYNIKNGVRVARYAVASHHNHVHIAVPLGVILAQPIQPPFPPPPVPAPQPPTTIEIGPEEPVQRRTIGPFRLDNQGNGWIAIPDIEFNDYRNVHVQGSYPPVDGYWPLPKVGVQQREGVVIEITDGLPNQALTLFVDYV